MKCTVMIWRSWVGIPVRSNLGCVVLLSQVVLELNILCPWYVRPNDSAMRDSKKKCTATSSSRSEQFQMNGLWDRLMHWQSIFLDQIWLRQKLYVLTPSLTPQDFEPMTSRSWQYISCSSDASLTTRPSGTQPNRIQKGFFFSFIYRSIL